MSKRRIKITRQVTGRIKNGKIILLYNKQVIGTIHLKDKIMECSDGYEVQKCQIYRIENNENKVDHYAKDCDLGWC